MIQRAASQLLTDRLKAYPAVALVGPRQCGKTTLAKSFAGEYFDIEQETERIRLDLRWDQLAAGNQLVILDEAQSWPELFVRLRGAIDGDRKRHGRFLLLGSVSPALMTKVSESLAGRLSVLELTPLLWGEMPRQDRSKLWLYGGYPDGGILNAARFPQWQKDYLALLAQRDLPQWGFPARAQVIERYLRMLAGIHGQTWNASQLGQSMGLDHKTVSGYLDFLRGAFLVRRLLPYEGNIRKRLVKSPKVYWRDSGLLHALMNITDEESLLVQPWVGASWEGFVIEQILGTLQTRGLPVQEYYFRTSDQHELDLVLDWGKEKWAIEIKLTSAPGVGDLARLDKGAEIIDARRRFLISRVTQTSGNEVTTSCNIAWFLENLPG